MDIGIRLDDLGLSSGGLFPVICDAGKQSGELAGTNLIFSGKKLSKTYNIPKRMIDLGFAIPLFFRDDGTLSRNSIFFTGYPKSPEGLVSGACWNDEGQIRVIL